MKKFKKAFILILAVIAIWFLIDLLKPSKYNIGMTYVEAVQLMVVPGKKEVFLLDYETNPTEKQLTEDAVYEIYDEAEGVILEFNYYDKIIKIQRVKFVGIDLVKVKRIIE